MSDDLPDDPVVRAILAAEGLSLDALDWAVESRWASDGHAVLGATHVGRFDVRLRRHDDEDAAWFATIQIGASSYHAQRGRRSVTIREHLPESARGALVGRRASDLVDAPGMDALGVLSIRGEPPAMDAVLGRPEDVNAAMRDNGDAIL